MIENPAFLDKAIYTLKVKISVVTLSLLKIYKFIFHDMSSN